MYLPTETQIGAKRSPSDTFPAFETPSGCIAVGLAVFSRPHATQCGYAYLRSSESGQDHALAVLPKDQYSHELADSKGFLIWDAALEVPSRDPEFLPWVY